jgi:hypothetical protein
MSRYVESGAPANDKAGFIGISPCHCDVPLRPLLGRKPLERDINYVADRPFVEIQRQRPVRLQVQHGVEDGVDCFGSPSGPGPSPCTRHSLVRADRKAEVLGGRGSEEAQRVGKQADRSSRMELPPVPSPMGVRVGHTSHGVPGRRGGATHRRRATSTRRPVVAGARRSSRGTNGSLPAAIRASILAHQLESTGTFVAPDEAAVMDRFVHRLGQDFVAFERHVGEVRLELSAIETVKGGGGVDEREAALG